MNLGPQICLRPLWLYHHVVGPLLAPPYFPFGLPSQNSGEVSLKDIESALRAFQNDLKRRGTPSSYMHGDCRRSDSSSSLPRSVHSGGSHSRFPLFFSIQFVTTPGSKMRHLTCIEGQRYECSLSVDNIYLAVVIRRLSISLFSHGQNDGREAWKDGVKLVRIVDDRVVESRIELGIKKGHCCIDVILRWSRY